MSRRENSSSLLVERNMPEESLNPFFGKLTSIVTKAGIEYEGNLYTVWLAELSSYFNLICFCFLTGMPIG
jgi:hypothetical protein